MFIHDSWPKSKRIMEIMEGARGSCDKMRKTSGACNAGEAQFNARVANISGIPSALSSSAQSELLWSFKFYKLWVKNNMLKEIEATEEIKNVLERNNLAQYWDSFSNLGYDDLPQLLEMSAEDLTVVITEVGLVYKPGHRKRLVAALQILNSKSKHLQATLILLSTQWKTKLPLKYTCKFYIL